eukprot:gene16002-biopygen4590
MSVSSIPTDSQNSSPGSPFIVHGSQEAPALFHSPSLRGRKRRELFTLPRGQRGCRGWGRASQRPRCSTRLAGASDDALNPAPCNRSQNSSNFGGYSMVLRGHVRNMLRKCHQGGAFGAHHLCTALALCRNSCSLRVPTYAQSSSAPQRACRGGCAEGDSRRAGNAAEGLVTKGMAPHGEARKCERAAAIVGQWGHSDLRGDEDSIQGPLVGSRGEQQVKLPATPRAFQPTPRATSAGEGSHIPPGFPGDVPSPTPRRGRGMTKERDRRVGTLCRHGSARRGPANPACPARLGTPPFFESVRHARSGTCRA